MLRTPDRFDRSAGNRPPAHPGGILRRHYLEPLGIAASSAASALGISRKTLHKILSERGVVTPEMALRLSKALDTTPELWLNLQRNYDLWRAAHGSRASQRARTIVGRGDAAVKRETRQKSRQ
jgi:antitoxin HigA-1